MMGISKFDMMDKNYKIEHKYESRDKWTQNGCLHFYVYMGLFTEYEGGT